MLATLGSLGVDAWGGNMVLARSYAVLDFWVVEVSCVHSEDPTQSHLIYREEFRSQSRDLSDCLAAMSEVLHAAAMGVRSGELWESDDCPL